MAQLSTRGAHFIGRFEGWRDKPYNDAADNATIGFGHLIHMGPVTPHDVSEWGTTTMDHGIKLLQSDASIAETAIDHYITRALCSASTTRLRRSRSTAAGVRWRDRWARRSTRGAGSDAVSRAVGPRRARPRGPRPSQGRGGALHDGRLRRRRAAAAAQAAAAKAKTAKPAPLPTEVPKPVPDWAWLWVEWKLGRAKYKGHAGDPHLRESTGAPATVPPWAWTFLKRF